MDLKTFTTGACTTAEIQGLSNHDTPEAAMKDFIEKSMITVIDQYGYSKKSAGSRFSKLDSVWVFSAAEDGAYNYYGKYGTKFAQYILDNGLGEIATLPKRINHKYHPDRTSQTWLWGPDRDALINWYNEKYPPKVDVKPPMAMTPPAPVAAVPPAYVVKAARVKKAAKPILQEEPPF